MAMPNFVKKYKIKGMFGGIRRDACGHYSDVNLTVVLLWCFAKGPNQVMGAQPTGVS
jgi:hypothetical protein